MVRLTDCLDMTIAVDWDVKAQTKPKKILLEKKIVMEFVLNAKK